MKKILTLLILLMFNYSCVSTAEGNTIKKNVAKIDAKYKMLENRVSNDQNKVKRKLRRVDAKILEMNKILKEAKKLLHHNNADFGQDMVQMDVRLKKAEGKNEEILFKFEQLEKKFKKLKEEINDVNGNIAMNNSSNTGDFKNKNQNGKTNTVEKDNKDNKDNKLVSAGNSNYKKVNNPIALFKLGYAYIDGKKYKSMNHKDRMNMSIEIFNFLIKKFPKHNKANSARYWITQAYYSSGQYEKAYRVMSKFLERYPKSRHISQILFQMANSLKNLGLKKDSKTLFKTLIKLYPKSGYSKKASSIIKNL